MPDYQISTQNFAGDKSVNAACGALMPTDASPDPFAGLVQTWPMPTQPRPITILGAGGIVRDGHMPAYRKMGLPVAGIFDINQEAARRMAAEFGIPVAHRTLDEATEACGAKGVFDLA